MVKKAKITYSYAGWRKENPVEADIFDLINAAKSHALSKVPHVGGESGDPEDPPIRFDDEPTELEGAIERAERAIAAMMRISQARAAAGMKKRGRGKDKSFDPDKTNLTDPQVQVVLEMLRNKKAPAVAFSEVAEIIAPKGNIDTRTLRSYIEALIGIWGSYAASNRNPFWVHNTDL